LIGKLEKTLQQGKQVSYDDAIEHPPTGAGRAAQPCCRHAALKIKKA
jgi:hypothetical protein